MTVGNVPPNGYTTHIDRISAGHDVNVVLEDPLIQTNVTPFAYEVTVDETPAVTSPDSPNPMTVIDHFRPGTPGSTPTVLPVGVFGTTLDVSSYEDYDFGSATDTNSGIIAGNDINVSDYSDFFYVSGYAHVGGTLTLHVDGSLNLR